MKQQRRFSGGMRWGSLWAVVLLVAGWALPAATEAQTCEVPLFVTQGSIDANVMILFDNSGSMNEAMFHADYNPDQDYSGNFDNDRTYYISSDAWRSPKNFNSNWSNAPWAYLVNSDRGQSGRYRGNYLNWIYFHANDLQRMMLPVVTRVQVAKLVVNDIIDRSSRIRFGLTIFDYDDGGTVIADCGASKADLINTITNISANSWTPLGETLEDILNYFKRTGSDAPIQEPCQFNFCIVMTDGFPTMDRDVSSYLRDADGDGNDPGNCASIGAPYPESNNCSDYMDDVAYYMRHNDLRTDLGEPGESWEDGQNVITYTIGFGIDAGILSDTAFNGDGAYLSANNAVELWTSLQLIMMDIVSRISSGSAVAVVSTERGSDNFIYRGKFMPGSWQGFLEAFQMPYHDGASPVWEAGSLLANRNPSDRNIFTAIGQNVYQFDSGAAGSLASTMEVDPGEAATVIQWARGTDMTGYRNRDNWRLGDIIHSTPVVVGGPNNFVADEAYQEFLATYSNRQKMIYVGGNDGMLHAFVAESGWEAWAFVPEFALPKLPQIASEDYCHLYTCDQTPSIRDVTVGGVWRTVMVAGGRGGGASYFALDITEPYSPSFLWQATLPDGHAYASEPEFAQVEGETYVLIGSGLDTTAGEAFLYALDMEDGSLVETIDLSSGAVRNRATTPRAVDRDLDGQSDLIYVSDMAGHVWRVDVQDGSWDKSLLFATDQEITAPPMPAYGEDNKIYVYFGTGAYLDETDASSLNQNTFYCVFDSHDGSSHTRYDLADQTSVPGEIGLADGWYVDLIQSPAERVTEKAAVAVGTVYFTSFAPSQEACEVGGRSWLYQMAYDDASEVEDEHDGGSRPRTQELGEGLASRPVVDIINAQVIIQSSESTIVMEDIGGVYFHLNVRSWQEDYQIPSSNEGDANPEP